MRNKCLFCFITASTIVDAVVALILFSRITHFKERFTIEVKFYEFSSSTFEFLILGFVRVLIQLGCVFGFCFGSLKIGLERLKFFSPFAAFLSGATWAFAIIKMLAYTEGFVNEPRWFWYQFSWVHIGALLFFVNHLLLRRAKCSRLRDSQGINCLEDERQPLLGENEEERGSSADDEKEISAKHKASNILRLMYYSKPDILFLLVAFFFMVLSAVSEIFTPWYTGKVIQGIAIDKSQETFTWAIILMSLFSGGSAIAAGIRGGFFKVAMSRMNIRIRNVLFTSIVRQEIGFFDVTKTGEITSRLTSDATTMSDALSLNLNIFVRSIIKAVGICVFMFKLSWRLSMVTVVGLPIIMSVSHLYGKYYKTLSQKVQDSLAEVNEVAEEVCSSMRTVKSFANEYQETQRYGERLNVTYKLKVKEAYAYAGYMWSNQLFSLSLIVSTLYYGGHLVVSSRMTGGDLVSFILYQMELGYAFESISGVYTGLMQAVGASEKVFEYIDRKPTFSSDGNLSPENLCGKIDFKDVTFSYPSRSDTFVLKNVTFSIEPGEVVALVGPSGGGKSSCVNLVEHFYETQQGQVLLDGHPIKEYDHKYLHKKIALVGQEPVLFARSVKDNIAYGLDTWSMDEVITAAQMANAHGFIMDMKEQYEAETGEKGAQLSGGQKQRIALARALVRNPTILLLDEATSALDSESEHLVKQALYRNLKGRTVIIIAHRLSTVERADRIIVINRGGVVEQGTHAQLLQKTDGVYHQLVQHQLLGLDNAAADDVQDQPQQPAASCSRKLSREIMDSGSTDNEGLPFLKSSPSSRSSRDILPTKFGSPNFDGMT